MDSNVCPMYQVLVLMVSSSVSLDRNHEKDGYRTKSREGELEGKMERDLEGIELEGYACLYEPIMTVTGRKDFIPCSHAVSVLFGGYRCQ